MKILQIGLPAAFLLGLVLAGKAPAGDIFPYPIHSKRLPNGLTIVLVPFDSPGIVAYYTIVRAGSRNEIEPGLSGFAHFFEHMMFRGTEKYSPEEYNELFKELGSDANAFTTDDYTCYHTVFGAAGLERVIEAEADRFRNLKYSLPAFQQESRAVLGEYYKNYSNPSSKMHEKIRDTAFEKHTYKHTTMGFLEDIKDMPNQYEYSIEFYNRWYRPNNVAVLVVGDIDVDRTFGLIENYYKDWEPARYDPAYPVEPAQKEFKQARIEWENETLPYISIAYHAPAFDPASKDNACLDILAQLVFGSNSPLYKKLVIEDQSVEYIRSFVPTRRDPYLFMIAVRAKRDDRIDAVKDQIYAAIRDVRENPIDPAKLAAIQSRIRYSFAMSLDTASSIARSLADYIELTGNPRSVNEFYKRYEEVTPEDIRMLARRCLQESNCTEVTLTGVKK
ncbi:MAG: insulinase family protein [Chitinivibrionia bacterium]|nr:insulinase family protein [Chitinivibrionia bacterium]